MGLLEWILLIVVLAIIGVVVVLRFAFRKGRKGYQRGRDAIRDRRERRQER